MSKIRSWPQPKTQKDLMAFLGFVQYYSGFIPEFAQLTARLNSAKAQKIDRSSNTYPNLVLDIDFSKTAIAAVLHQGNEEKGLRFTGAKSRKLRSYERNYHSSKGELLALFFGLGKFSHILKGQEFLVRMDNLTVTYWETASLSSNPILSRWLDFLAQFSFSVKHISGKFLIPADVLSRLIDGGNLSLIHI